MVMVYFLRSRDDNFDTRAAIDIDIAAACSGPPPPAAAEIRMPIRR
jgi:hypothetical protein